MKIQEYCGNIDFSILQFIHSFTDHIRKKITKKELFYREQIERYAKKRIDFFLKGFNLKSALFSTYKYEVFNTIMFKLNKILQEHNVMRCV
jgi:hypothetical protein